MNHIRPFRRGSPIIAITANRPFFFFSLKLFNQTFSTGIVRRFCILFSLFVGYPILSIRKVRRLGFLILVSKGKRGRPLGVRHGMDSHESVWYDYDG